MDHTQSLAGDAAGVAAEPTPLWVCRRCGTKWMQVGKTIRPVWGRRARNCEGRIENFAPDAGRSNVNHIDGNDVFSLENTAHAFEAALAATAGVALPDGGQR